jgi:putative hydrolase of the HAD superfamily
MIRNVIFDLGGVLVTWRPREIIENFYAEPELRTALGEQVFAHPDWVELDRGTLDEQTAARRFAERTSRPVEEMVALLERVRESLQPVPDTVALAESLRSRGLNLYALSNISQTMFDHIRARHAFFDLFSGIVISGAINAVKPEPVIYQHLAERYSLVFAESVFVDDLPANVEAARRLGLAAVLFEDAAQCGRDLERLLGP